MALSLNCTQRTSQLFSLFLEIVFDYAYIISLISEHYPGFKYVIITIYSPQ